LMDHPNIAHIFDGGETKTGRPFFVMELVRGILRESLGVAGRFSARDRGGGPAAA